MYYIIVFIVGLLFGSFGSVILHRLGEEITWKKIRSALVGRSHCPHCQRTLARYDLFPLVSWLSTLGKCRYCHTTISKRYPLLELWSGLVFIGIYYRWSLYGGWDLTLLVIFLFLNWCFYLLMIHDIKTMYLHNAAWRLSVLWAIILLFHNADALSLISAAQWMFVFGVGFLAFYRLAKIYVHLRRKQNAEWIGQWDVMLAPIVGLVLWKVHMLMIGGTADRINIFQYFRYYVIAACVAALLLLMITPITKEEWKRLIPFFPGMIVGIWMMLLVLPLLVQFL